MIISCITDRLGNQLFQYAAAKALAVKNNTSLKINKRYYEHNTPKGFFYELDHFCIQQVFATESELKEYTWVSDSIFYRAIRKVVPKYSYYEKGFEYDNNFNSLGDKVYLRGFWQSYKYFEGIEDIIRQEFLFREVIDMNSDIFAKNIFNSESVCISIRRGDHITNLEVGKKFNQCSREYYEMALEIIEQKYKNLKLFVFSDDIDWCKTNIKFKYNTIFVDNIHKVSRFDYYLQLMAMCKHFVIPVSTFPWWGAWLSANKNKIVIAPKIWFNDPNIDTDDLCPPNWVRI